MRLFAYAFAAASSSGVALVLMTDNDLSIEVQQAKILRRSNYKALKKYHETAELHERLRLEGHEFICVDEEYHGPVFLHYSHLSDSMKQKLMGTEDE